MRLIDADAVVTIQTYDDMYEEWRTETMTVEEAMDKFSDEGCPPTVDAEPVRRGHWMLKAHNERVNCRWHVDAECSECRFKREEIYVGFFPGVPDQLAHDIILDNAESVKLYNYCPHCGADMRGKQDAD